MLVALVLFSVVAITVIISEILSQTNKVFAYLILPARIFELLIGAVLALYFSQLPNFKDVSKHLLSLLGILLIVIPAIMLNSESTFPGFNALWPCLGTALLIITGKGNNSAIIN